MTRMPLAVIHVDEKPVGAGLFRCRQVDEPGALLGDEARNDRRDLLAVAARLGRPTNSVSSQRAR